MNAPKLAQSLLFALFVSASLAACSSYETRAGGPAMVSAGVLTGLFWPLVYWTLRGMEVGLVTVVVLLLVWLAWRATDGAGDRPDASVPSA